MDQAPQLMSKRIRNQQGAVLFVVLMLGIVMALVLFVVMGRSARNRIDTVKSMKGTQEFYLADAGFNYIKTKATALNIEGGSKKVQAFMDAQVANGWQKLAFNATDQGYFRLEKFKIIPVPLSIEFKVQGVKDPTKFALKYESAQGVLRVPSMARYARYVEGNSTLTYTGGTTVDGEILVAGDINLSSSTVKFTRLVGTGSAIINPGNGQYDFGFRLKQVDIPTLNHVHLNAWDNYMYDATKYPKTFQYFAKNGGIAFMDQDPSPQNPAWNDKNTSGACTATGPCDTLFSGCFDTLSVSLRSPVVVAGSAVLVDLSKIVVTGDSIVVFVSPVVYDAGGDGMDWFALGTPERRYARLLSTFKDNAVLYFPGDIYLTGQLRSIPITVASGDDVFLYGTFIGPVKSEVDAAGMPVTLGIVAQDRIYIHESSSRELTIRAAILAENDEVIYEDALGVPGWRFGYVCQREIYAPVNMPVKGVPVVFSAYFKDNFIWDDGRVKQAGFGREPEEECRADGTCPNKIMESYGFAALGFARTGGSAWKFKFEGSLITRNPGSKGPKNDCGRGWDCDTDAGRMTWAYDDNLGVAYPPKFPAPVVDDRNPSQVVGFKRKSF
jgi:type II secretory pathway pseudopilin PulG